MGDNILKISKKDTVRGEDGYKVFSIRIKDDIVAELDKLAVQSNRSRNELINMILEFGITHSVVED